MAPQVERGIAVHLYPQSAAIWQNHLCLPSKASATKAYGAAGQAASALHAMVLLHVYQAKPLKELHEGCSEMELMQELRGNRPHPQGDKSHRVGPRVDDVHYSDPGTPSLAEPS